MAEHYVTLAEVRDMLAAEEGARELLTSQRQALEHSQRVMSLSTESALALRDEILAMSDIEGMSEALAVKIADILPQYPEDVRAIMSKERILLEPEQINKILDTVAKYL
ncbi:MAG: hypothetical protein IJ856_02765 [Candidatus Methanomethylophilaceae archaeon]|nr:hypothetical protein [Candidatus Methanomethylophilaceae archaeon]